MKDVFKNVLFDVGNTVFNRRGGAKLEQITPYFSLPSNGVRLMVGQPCIIYGDSLIAVAIKNNLHVTYTCDIGTQSGNNLVLNPVIGDIGDHACSVNFKNGTLDETHEITLTVAAQSSAANLNVLMIGDSTLSLGIDYIGASIESALSNSTINYIGTQGTTRKHEGRSGASISWFAENASSPFVKSGVINIPAYFTDNSITQWPDVVYIRLGLNDIAADATMTDGMFDYILARMSLLVDGFLALGLGIKVIVSLTTTTESTGVGWEFVYDGGGDIQNLFLSNMHHFQQHIVTTYANKVYNNRVNCSYDMIHLDRNGGYPNNNGIHPNNTGYTELGVGLVPYINKIIGEFGNELVSQTLWHTEGYWGAKDDYITFDGSKITHSSASIGWMLVGGDSVMIMGHLYKMSMTVTGTGAITLPYSAWKDSYQYVDAPGAYTRYEVVSMREYILQSYNFLGTITKLSIREVVIP